MVCCSSCKVLALCCLVLAWVSLLAVFAVRAASLKQDWGLVDADSVDGFCKFSYFPLCLFAKTLREEVPQCPSIHGHDQLCSGGVREHEAGVLFRDSC